MLSSLPCCPTVLMKYPSVQNSPPHSFFFTSGHEAKISRAVMGDPTLFGCAWLTILLGRVED